MPLGDLPRTFFGGSAGRVAQSDIAGPRLKVYQQTIGRAAFTDGGALVGSLNLGVSIPAGAVVVRTIVDQIVGFIGDTTATVNVGDADVDRFNTGNPSVFATAAQGVDMGVPSGTAWLTAAVTPIVRVTSTADFTNVSAGSMRVTIFWYDPNA